MSADEGREMSFKEYDGAIFMRIDKATDRVCSGCAVLYTMLQETRRAALSERDEPQSETDH